MVHAQTPSWTAREARGGEDAILQGSSRRHGWTARKSGQSWRGHGRPRIALCGGRPSPTPAPPRFLCSLLKQDAGQVARGVRALANTCRHYAWREYDVAISKYLYQADQGKINAVVATLLPPCIALSAVAGAAVGQRQQRFFFLSVLALETRA